MILSIAAVGLLTARCSSDIPAVVSPNGIVGFVGTDSSGYFVTYKGQNVLEITNLGFADNNQLADFKLVGTVHDEYDMLSGKKLHCENMATEFTANLGKNVQLILRVYNDGIAFRYRLHGMDGAAIPAAMISSSNALGTAFCKNFMTLRRAKIVSFISPPFSA